MDRPQTAHEGRLEDDLFGRQRVVPIARQVDGDAALLRLGLVVIAIGVLGAAIGLMGLLQRGRRKSLSVMAIPLHLLVATGFFFLIGMLA